MSVTHQERLVPSVWMIAVIAGLILSVAIVYFVYQPASIAWGVTLVLAVAALAVMIAGATRVQVTPSGLTVGRSHLETRYIGQARSLSVAETRARLGPDADPRAHLVTRPYLNRAVEVTVDDPADPHPYWLISTRRPEELAHALHQTLQGKSGQGTTGQGTTGQDQSPQGTTGQDETSRARA